MFIELPTQTDIRANIIEGTTIFSEKLANTQIKCQDSIKKFAVYRVLKSKLDYFFYF